MASRVNFAIRARSLSNYRTTIVNKKSTCIYSRVTQYLEYKKLSFPTRPCSCLSGKFTPVLQHSLSKVRKRNLSTQPYYDIFPVTVAQSVLDHVHLYTGLPWWATIIITTLTMRAAITLPLARYQALILAKIELLQPTLKELAEALKHNVAVKGKRAGKTVEEVNKIYLKQFRRYTYDLYKRDGCNPIKLYILPWIQLPLWIIISLALRNMSGFFPKGSTDDSTDTTTPSFPPYPEFHTEGTLWFLDLCVPDPTWILPLILGLTNLANVELNSLRRQAPTGKQRAITNVFRVLSILMVGVAMQVPSVSTFFDVAANTLLLFLFLDDWCLFTVVSHGFFMWNTPFRK